MVPDMYGIAGIHHILAGRATTAAQVAPKLYFGVKLCVEPPPQVSLYPAVASIHQTGAQDHAANIIAQIHDILLYTSRHPSVMAYMDQMANCG